MLNERYLKTEKDLIGEIWQTSQIHKNMLILADEIGSRFPGTHSEKQAQKYLFNKLREYGYENSRVVPFNYYGWKRGPVVLKMTEPIIREFKAISLAMSPGGTVEAEVVNLGTGSPNEFKAIDPSDVKGKIVLCSSATSPEG